MNKQKRKIIQLQCSMVKKLAAEITPFASDTKVLNVWYTDRLVTPKHAATVIKTMKTSKLHRVFHVIYKSDKFPTRAWGNMFTIKFPMCLVVAGRTDRATVIHNEYLKWIEVALKK